MNHPKCSKCGIEMLLIESINNGQAFIYACLDCDIPQEPNIYIYQNHCWNCGFGIDSRFSAPSPMPDMGYVCGHCGKDLFEWKLRRGLIMTTQIYGGQHAIL